MGWGWGVVVVAVVEVLDDDVELVAPPFRAGRGDALILASPIVKSPCTSASGSRSASLSG